MKKIYVLLLVAGITFSLSNCTYDDSALWNEMEQIKDRISDLEESVLQTNEEIEALQSIINALQNNLYITSVEQTADGYTIVFSDGTSANIMNGKDGVNGTNAPLFSVKQDTDGNYYWTIDGEWLLVGGEKVRANGLDGENGQDAIAPQIRINDITKEWEISTDGGMTWIPTGVVAEGTGTVGDSLFESIDTSHEDYIIITLTDGTEFTLARYDESAPLFIIKDAPEVAEIEYGTTTEFAVNSSNIAEYTINSPQGWKGEYSENTLFVTAPAKDLCHYDSTGTISIMVVSDAGKCAIVKLNVAACEKSEPELPYELRVLTFEDQDARFESYWLDYAGVEITTWSDLIDNPQYGGPLTYADMSSAEYHWYDEGNTELSHTFPYNY